MAGLRKGIIDKLDKVQLVLIAIANNRIPSTDMKLKFILQGNAKAH